MVQALQRYVGSHFDVEENYMKTFGYAGYEEHRAAHDRFGTDFEVFGDKVRRGGMTSVLALELKRRVSVWELEHVRVMDKPMCAYIVAKRREREAGEAVPSGGR